MSECEALEALQEAARMVDEVNGPLGSLLFERREIRLAQRIYEMALLRFLRMSDGRSAAR